MKNKSLTLLFLCSLLLFSNSPYAYDINQAVPESEVEKIIQKYASSSTGKKLVNYCNASALSSVGKTFEQLVIENVDKKANAFNRGAYGEASSDVAALKIASCYQQLFVQRSKGSESIKKSVKNFRGSRNLKYYAGNIGELVAISILAKSKAGIDIDPSSKSFKDALVLMTYARQNGYLENRSFEVLEKYRKEKSELAPSNSNNFVHVEAVTLIKEIKKNALRFKRKYHGKSISAVGKVHKIGEFSDGNIYVKLFGEETWNPEGRAEDGPVSSTHLLCKLDHNSQSENKAISLNTGDEVVVTGVFEYNIKMIVKIPTINRCQII